MVVFKDDSGANQVDKGNKGKYGQKAKISRPPRIVSQIQFSFSFFYFHFSL